MFSCTLWGRLGREVEKKETSDGKGFHTFPLAVDFFGVVKKTLWVKCVVWESAFKMVEKKLPTLKKGSKVIVRGDMGYPRHFTKDGETNVTIGLSVYSIIYCNDEPKDAF